MTSILSSFISRKAMADCQRFASVFMKTVLEGDVSKVKRMVDASRFGKEFVGILSPEGLNALHLAAEHGKTRMCEFLIHDLNFDINCRNPRGMTPLMFAIERRHDHTAVYLIEKGADILLANVGGSGPLHSAAQTGQIKIMRLLLDRGVRDLNTGKVYTPLQCACFSRKKEAVQLLLDHGADPNATAELYESALMISIGEQWHECMEMLLKAGADPDLISSGRTALTFAACKGDTKVIKRLLKAGANPDVPESVKLMTPLEVAALYRHVDAVKTLFPVTSRISSIPDWSVEGVLKIERAFTPEGLKELKRRDKEYFEKAKAKGRAAFEKKEYFDAIGWYNQAEKVNPISMDVVSNRSLCWAKLNCGKEALKDAEMCVGVTPEWAKGHYRLGAARMLLHEYPKAVEAFAEAMKLNPKNEDIKKAHREAVEAELAARRPGSGSTVF